MKSRKKIKKKYIDYVVDRLKKSPKLMTVAKQIRSRKLKPVKTVKT